MSVWQMIFGIFIVF